MAIYPSDFNQTKAVTYGQGTADGRPAFGVNWRSVGYYNEHFDKLNSFQLVLIDRSNIGTPGDFDAEFNYNEILWEAGDYSNGFDGYGGNAARVGITNGVDSTVEVQYSGETIKQLDSIPQGFPNAGTKNYASGLIYRKRNSTVPGRMVFQFRNGNLLDALQVDAGDDQPLSSNITTTNLTGSASDPSGSSLTINWSVIENTGSVPVVITDTSQLGTSVSFSAGAKVSLQLTVNRTGDPTVKASDVMVINP